MKSLLVAVVAVAASVACAETKVGIIGCDTSHTIAFTKLMNVEKKDFAQGFRVTVATKWGSKELKECLSRYDKYIPQMQEMGVEIVPTIADLLAKCDVVCLETCDGRPHLEQAIEVFKSGKLVFIDKPIAHDYANAKKIYEAGLKYGAKYFSSSALRYADAQQDCRNGKYGKIGGCDYFAPSPIEEQGTHSRYTWYGIHGFEPILTVMGGGVASVRTIAAKGLDIVVMTWKDGRIATLRANNDCWSYGGTAHPVKGKSVPLGGYEGYEKLLQRIIGFFKTGVVPVPNEETLDLFAVMEAAAKSRAEGGRTVLVSEITESVPNTLTESEKADGWELLWNGKDFGGWVRAAGGCTKAPEAGWTIEDGVLTIHSRGEQAFKDNKALPKEERKVWGGDIVTTRKFGDFVFAFDFRLTPGANSGVKYYYDEKQNQGTCEEFQVLHPDHPDAKLGKNGNRRVASLYDVIPANAEGFLKPTGAWNTGCIVAKGKKVQHWLNGNMVVEYERGTEAFRKAIAASKYAKWGKAADGKPQPWGEVAEGRILLQDHSDHVSYRNLKIKTK